MKHKILSEKITYEKQEMRDSYNNLELYINKEAQNQKQSIESINEKIDQ